MYSLKSRPEDFIVREITSIKLSESAKAGQHAVFVLEKKGLATEQAVNGLCRRMKILRKNIGYAGLKDRHAVTSQYISIKYGKKSFEKTVFRNFSILFKGFSDQGIALGDLKENSFEVVVRNIDKNELETFKKNFKEAEKNGELFPNFFGPQRFSKKNKEIGRALIKKDFKAAVGLLTANNGQDKENQESKSGFYENEVVKFLSKYPRDYVGALRLIPRKILTLFVNSYQSYIFNKVLETCLLERSFSYKKFKNTEIPIVGFGSQINPLKNVEDAKSLKAYKFQDLNPNSLVSKETLKLMGQEKILPRDFIVRQIPELSSEGTSRKAFAKAGKLSAEIGNDELNEDMNKVKLCFSLPKGSYATVFVDWLFRG